MRPNFEIFIILYAEDYDDDNDGIYDEYDNDDDNDGIPDVIVSGKPNGDIWTILKKEILKIRCQTKHEKDKSNMINTGAMLSWDLTILINSKH